MDGSCFGNLGKGGTGGVVRNYNGDWVMGFIKTFLTGTNNQMELLALLEGLKMIEMHNLTPIQIVTDSIEIIKMLKEGYHLYDGIIDEYRCRLR